VLSGSAGNVGFEFSKIGGVKKMRNRGRTGDSFV